MVGYFLDWQQCGGTEGKMGRRGDVVYLLEGGLVESGKLGEAREEV